MESSCHNVTIERNSYNLFKRPWDGIVLAVYFIGLIGIGIWTSRRKTNHGSTEGYFLAGRSVPWWAIGTSLFASNIGSEHFIGLAGTGAASGVAVSAYELHAVWIVLLLGWLFAPIYLKSGVYTMPQFLGRRFQSPRLRAFVSVYTLISYILTKVSVDLYAGDVFMKEALGWDIYPSTITLLVITGIYTITGGLAAVIYTEVLQSVIMVAGSFVLMVLSFNKVGGLSGLREKWPGNYTYSVPNGTCDVGAVPDNAFHMFRSPSDEKFPWPAVVIAIPSTGIFYWCSSQVMVQRVLGAKNAFHAKLGTILCGLLKILPLFLIVLPGMIARTLYPRRVGCGIACECEEICDNSDGCSNIAYPELVLNVLPTGLTGLLLAVMMAALMSSLASTFNSAGTMFTIDVWNALRPHSSQRQQVVVGYVVVVVMVVISVAWLPVLEALQGDQLFLYLQAISSYAQPPLSAVYLMGVFWTRTTPRGVYAGLTVGLLIGLVRFVLESVYNSMSSSGCEDMRPWVVRVHFIYVGFFELLVSLVITAVVSLVTEPIPRSQLAGLTWWTRNDSQEYSVAPTSSPEHNSENTLLVEHEVGPDVRETSLSANAAGGGTASESEAGLSEDDMPGGNVDEHTLESDHTEETVEKLFGFRWSPTGLKWFLRIAVVVQLTILLSVWIVFR
ncbi:sodium/glucose cotransporter 4-like isoform X1 [Sycon ciliatum]|uniref:sodium/glucose cotransporter 4-like isoform X1 n=2 Tax=Sycon ciliatum TaxID=27933 RepID=UPI0031F6001B